MVGGRKPKPSFMETMSETDWAYLAGVIDGEGSITMFITKYNKIHWRISIAQQDGEMMSWLAQYVGGGIYLSGKAKPGLHKLNVLQWKMSSNEQVRFALGRLVPYLTSKKNLALKAIESLDSCRAILVG